MLENVQEMLPSFGNRLSVRAACCGTDACKICFGSSSAGHIPLQCVNLLVRSELRCTCSLPRRAWRWLRAAPQRLRTCQVTPSAIPCHPPARCLLAGAAGAAGTFAVTGPHRGMPHRMCCAPVDVSSCSTSNAADGSESEEQNEDQQHDEEEVADEDITSDQEGEVHDDEQSTELTQRRHENVAALQNNK